MTASAATPAGTARTCSDGRCVDMRASLGARSWPPGKVQSDGRSGYHSSGAVGPEVLVELRARRPGRCARSSRTGCASAVRDGRLGAGRAAALLARARARPRRVAAAGRRRLRPAPRRGLPRARGAGAGTFVAAARPPAARRPRRRGADGRRPCRASTSSPAPPTSPRSRARRGCAATRDVAARRARRAPGTTPTRAAPPPLRRALAAHLRRAARRRRRPRARRRRRRRRRRASRCWGGRCARPARARSPSRTRACPPHRLVLAATGARGRARRGRRATASASTSWRRSGAAAAVVTPAHQFPPGVALRAGPARGAAGLGARPAGWWSRTTTTPSSATTARRSARCRASRPSHVAYLGSASKTLAPGAAPRLARRCRRASSSRSRATRRCDDAGEPVLEQLVLARLLDTAAYDRHLRVGAPPLPRAPRRAGRRARRRTCRARASRAWPPACTPSCACRAPLPADALLRRGARARRSASTRSRPAPAPTDRLALGYASLPEPAIAEGVRRLAGALRSLAG